jgi:TM2 domain-containing membrane protein YozV
MNETEEYTLRWRGRETGPFPLSEINRQLDEHEIGMGHEIFCNGKWITLEEFFTALKAASAPPVEKKEKTRPMRVNAAPASEPPIPRTIAGDETAAPRPRRRMLFAFLAIAGGYAGLHNFYARQWLTGLLQFLLTVATYLMGFGIIAAWIWAMVEAFVVHKDGDGIEMI